MAAPLSVSAIMTTTPDIHYAMHIVVDYMTSNPVINGVNNIVISYRSISGA